MRRAPSACSWCRPPNYTTVSPSMHTKRKLSLSLKSCVCQGFSPPSGWKCRFGPEPKKKSTAKRCFSFWRSGRDSNPRTAFGRHTISSRARYDHFDTTAYLNAQQQASLYQNWARSQYPIFAFPQKRDGAALRLFSFCLYFNCSSAASFRQQQKTSIACCSSSTGGRDGATRMLLSFGSTP